MSRMPPAAAAARAAAAPLQPDDCAAQVLEVMPAVMDAMRGTFRRHVGEQLSVPQFRCLNFISREPGSSVGAVAAFLGVTMPTASAMVDRLVRAGAVAPRTAARDRRRSELQVTEAGQAQLRQVWQGAHGEFARVLAGCTPEELQALQAGLATLRRVFQTA